MAYIATSAELIQRAYRYLREASASPTLWASAQVVDYLDEAHAFVCAEFNYLQSIWSVRTSSQVGFYAISAEMTQLRHVLWRKTSTDTLTRLEQASLPDFWAFQRNYDASGIPKLWALVGQAYALGIQLWPAPDSSATSGLVAFGNASPHSIATSASPLPRTILGLVPIYAAHTAWADVGAVIEAGRLAELYGTRAKRWKLITTDMSPDETELRTLGDDQSPRPLALSRGAPTESPLNM